MEIEVHSSLVAFKGFLNEESSLDNIKDALLSACRNSGAAQAVSLDFSGVKRANSCGIFAWLKLLESLHFCIIYVNTPSWLVDQFSSISDFLKGNVTVESIQAPFYCPENDSHEYVTLLLGKDIPIQASYDDFEIFCTNKDGAKLEADFEPREYFHFITANLDRFQGVAK